MERLKIGGNHLFGGLTGWDSAKRQRARSEQGGKG
jgi:hypothetical protein